MTQTKRRIYYSSAIVVFLIVGPLLVAWTAGYRWNGWKTGFIQTTSLSVFSEPKSELFLNGKSFGVTPVRISHMTPGPYSIELRKIGYASWQHEVRLTPNTAQIIGPVRLFPATIAVRLIDMDQDTFIVPAPSHATIMTGQTSGNQFIVHSLWPKKSTSSVTLSFQPLSSNTSRSGLATMYQSPTQSALVTSANTPWILSSLSQPIWDPSSDNLLYALQKNHAIRMDALQQQIDDFGPATSIQLSNGALWFTQDTGRATAILKQQTFGQHVPDIIMTIPGQWKFIPGPDNSLLLQESASKEVSELILNLVSGQMKTRTFGSVDQMWWTSRNEPPLWQRGTDLLTLDAEGHEQLLDRTAAIATTVAWVIPGHVVLTFDGQILAIRGVSNQQGHGVILQHQFDQPTTLLGLSITNQRVVFQIPGQPLTLTELSW